jgi:hypothetical protein
MYAMRSDRTVIINFIFFCLLFSDPTPDGVALLDGIPKFAPYNAADEFYMAIDEVWTTKSDYTLTYTVTADELNPSPTREENAGKKNIEC